jgi:hypothetical protein
VTRTAADLDGLSAPSYARLTALGTLGRCAYCGHLAVSPTPDEDPVHDPCRTDPYPWPPFDPPRGARP